MTVCGVEICVKLRETQDSACKNPADPSFLRGAAQFARQVSRGQNCGLPRGLPIGTARSVAMISRSSARVSMKCGRHWVRTSFRVQFFEVLNSRRGLQLFGNLRFKARQTRGLRVPAARELQFARRGRLPPAESQAFQTKEDP